MAVHVLAVLAYKDGDRVTSEFLARSVNTNPVVIRRLLLALQHARLVETRKGAGFGSRLSRSAARINLGEVFRAVEQDEAFCLPPKRPNPACPVGHCIQAELERIFGSALKALEQDLTRTTLTDVLKTVRESCADTSHSHK
jgi:DNA-binding IscR family transcriptional regulator